MMVTKPRRAEGRGAIMELLQTTIGTAVQLKAGRSDGVQHHQAFGGLIAQAFELVGYV